MSVARTALLLAALLLLTPVGSAQTPDVPPPADGLSEQVETLVDGVTSAGGEFCYGIGGVRIGTAPGCDVPIGITTEGIWIGSMLIPFPEVVSELLETAWKTVTEAEPVRDTCETTEAPVLCRPEPGLDLPDP